MTISAAIDLVLVLLALWLIVDSMREILAKQWEAYRFARAYYGGIRGPIVGAAFALYVQIVRPL
jgi:hypothetical protein